MAKLGLKSREGRPGGEKETSPGRARAAYSGATLLLRKQGVRGRQKLRPLWVFQSQSRAMRDDGLPRSRTRSQSQGRRPGASAARSRRVSTLETPPPAPDSAAAAAEQSHARLCRRTRLLQSVVVCAAEGLLSRRTRHPVPAPAPLRDRHQPPKPP